MKMSCSEIVGKIRRGTVFVERANGVEYVMTAIAKPKVIRLDDNKRQAIWRGRGEDGRIVEFCITERLEHYGPHISLRSRRRLP